MEKTERKILDMVEQGQISADDGLRLMNAMGQRSESRPKEEPIAAEVVYEPDHTSERKSSHISPEEISRMKRLKRWWLLPFGIGLIVLLLGAVWMSMGYQEAGFGLGFWLAWIPFLLGILIVAASVRTRKSVWFHLKVKQRSGEKPERINFGLPLPLSLAKWLFTAFGDKFTGLEDKNIGDFPTILENLSSEEPFYLHVNDDEDGEEVEIFIG